MSTSADPGAHLPIHMLLFCPACGEQHIDMADPPEVSNWTNPPHRSHYCRYCKHIWRPADVATNGVTALISRGTQDMDPRPARWYHVDEPVPPNQSIFMTLRALQGTTGRGGLPLTERIPAHYYNKMWYHIGSDQLLRDVLYYYPLKAISNAKRGKHEHTKHSVG